MFGADTDEMVTPEGFRNLLFTSYKLSMDHYPEGPQTCLMVSHNQFLFICNLRYYVVLKYCTRKNRLVSSLPRNHDINMNGFDSSVGGTVVRLAIGGGFE